MDYEWLIIIALVPVLISVQVYLLVLKMSEPEKLMFSIPGGLSADRQALLINHKNWLSAHGFQYLTSFQFSKIQVAAFKQENAQRFVSFNFLQSWNYDIVTHFNDQDSLTTSSSGAVGMFPNPPGTYKQDFPGASADDLWARHLAAEEYLTKKFGIVSRPLANSYEQTVVDGIRAQMKYVRSFAFWPVRSLYWYAVKRKQTSNRSIEQLYP